jgi:hypothetical protein
MAQEPATKTDGPQRPGRPSTYTSSIAEQICERIAEGEPLTKICRDEQIPAYRTVLGWRVANKEFSQMYARARLDAGDTLADQIRELAGRVERGELEPNAGRVAIDALKWIASKLKPSASLEVTTRPVDHMPEWMKQELEKASRSISKEAESTGNPAPPSPRPRRRQRR